MPALNEVVDVGGGGRRAAAILPSGVEEEVMIATGGEESERRVGTRRGWEGEPGWAKSLSATEASAAGAGGVSGPGDSSGEEAVSIDGVDILDNRAVVDTRKRLIGIRPGNDNN